MKGKQWVVDWTMGTLERCQPPDYGEVAAVMRVESAREVRAV